MGTLYVVKEFGRYHFFKTEAQRGAFMETLPEWVLKTALVYESRFGK